MIFPQLVWRITPSEKKIYLTFDDGPVPGPTEFVLDELKQFNAKATFFCIGDNVKKHPYVFAKVLEGGHTVGNHTFNHLKAWNYSTQEYIDNVALCANQFAIAGIQPPASNYPQLFRPPYGRIKSDQIKSLGGYRIIMWDVLTHDYSTSYSPKRCLNGSIRATRAGSIVVFHDSIKAERNLRYVLPRYLEHFRNKGFSFEELK